MNIKRLKQVLVASALALTTLVPGVWQATGDDGGGSLKVEGLIV